MIGHDNGDLGIWGVIDIETSGMDAQNDHIIDIGILVFDNFTVKYRYNSLVHSNKKLNPLITKLTGITDRDLATAPSWEQVKSEISFLKDEKITLMAHNAKFEHSFLKSDFPKITLVDSIPFLGLLHPKKSRLSLESLIVNLNIKEKEDHRGFEDAIDLLRVWIISLINTSTEKKIMLQTLALKFGITKEYESLYFPLSWMKIKNSELIKLLKSADFNYDEYLEKLSVKNSDAAIVDSDSMDSSEKFEAVFNGELINKIFQSEKAIRAIHPGYDYRESQAQMSLKIGQSFKNKIHALIQAPTGTGKTLGYLIPSMIFTKTQKETVLISTGTKSLQNQMMIKDIPLSKRILKNIIDEASLDVDDIKIVQLLGSNNHLCELMWQKTLEESGAGNQQSLFQMEKGDPLEKFSLLYFDYLFYLNGHFDYNQKINRNDIPFVLKKEFPEIEKTEKEISVDFRSCSGGICPLKENCSYFLGIKEAQKADIIIGNHSLTYSWPKGVKRPEYIILDEAHKIEEEATSSFTLKVEQKDLIELNNQLINMQGIGALFYLLQKKEGGFAKIEEIKAAVNSVQKSFAEQVTELADNIELIFVRLKNYQSLYWNEMLMFDQNNLQSGSLEERTYFNIFKIKDYIDKLEKVLSPYLLEWDVQKFDFKKEQNEIMSYTRFEVFVMKLTDIQTVLTALITKIENKMGIIRYLKDYGFSLEIQPIDVGLINWQQLLIPNSSVIFTSATLSVMSDKGGARGTEWALGYIYLDPAKRFKSGLYLPPVYDYRKNCKVFLVSDVPPLNDANFVNNIMELIIPTVEKLKGRSLLLFSARTRFEKATNILLEKFNGTIPLFVQGMGNNIVEEFKKSPWGILVGMESFGEGIDVPGDQISFIFIDKIPDLRQELIIEARRKYFDEKFGNEFLEYYLSYRAKNLQQKLGRLLRTNSDHGGVIIVDSRIHKWKEKTVNQFIELLNPYEVRLNKLKPALTEIEQFILEK